MPDQSWPSAVSVIVPARNAARTLRAAVLSALAQDVGVPLEVVVAVGPSTDGTGDAARELGSIHDRVHVTENPEGTTPAALNRALAASCGDVVVRLDAHALLPPGYIATAIEVLGETGAGNVGGRQVPTAPDGFAAAVAAAMSSPLGSGGAAYRTGTRARPAETVYLGVFRRQALDDVQGFDERLHRNQDYELNHRLQLHGWTVWFDPRLAVTYTPRGSVGALAHQYHDYGRFKRVVMREHPSSIRLRQLGPLAVVGGITAATAGGAVMRAWWVPAVAIGGYACVLLAAGVVADRRRAGFVAAALATMHWSWAMGFLQGPRAHSG